MVFKKAFRAGKKFVKKRYNVGGKRKLKNANTGAIVADVMKLMSMVNAEKKIYQLSLQTQYVGQVNVNSTGAICLDVTPMMGEGADQFQRNGISIKLHSQLWQFQISTEVFAQIANRVHIEFWYNTGTVLSQATLLTNVYDPSIFSGVIDMTSTRNSDHFGEYRLLRKHTAVLKEQSIAGAISNSTFQIPIKFNRGKGHHIRYTGIGSTNYLTDVQNGQIFMIIRADNGNASGTTASTLPVNPTGASTGAKCVFANKTWYYDN